MVEGVVDVIFCGLAVVPLVPFVPFVPSVVPCVPFVLTAVSVALAVVGFSSSSILATTSSFEDGSVGVSSSFSKEKLTDERDVDEDILSPVPSVTQCTRDLSPYDNCI